LVKKKAGLTIDTLAALRWSLQALGARCNQQMSSTSGVFVWVNEKPGHCPVCKGDQWRVQKSVPRYGKTLAHGQFEARETIYVCTAGCKNSTGTLVTHRADSLVRNIVPKSVVGYDVIVFVGIERFLHHKQREEIRMRLEHEYSIRLSSGGISHLCRSFVNYLARLHNSRTEILKTVLEGDGGWPMHVDATGEHGRGTIFAVVAGWRRWVLGAWKISTEHSEVILPCLREVVHKFGVPCAAMRDLGRAITPSINNLLEELDASIPVLACHQHFLADIGKDLLASSHSELREFFRRSKVRPKLRSLVRDYGRKIDRNITQAREAVLKWQMLVQNEHQLPYGLDGLAVVRAIAQWTLDYSADNSGLDFPYDRPYLTLYDRCLVAVRAVDAFLRTPPSDKLVLKGLERLRRILTPVDCDVPFRQITVRLRRRANLFDELRDTLRLTTNESKNETEREIYEINTQLIQFTQALMERRSKRGIGQDFREAIDLILAHFDRHGDNLWGHAIRLPQSAGGGVKLVDRTNNLLENLFKEIKHGERRRSGRKNLGQDLEHLPAEAILVKNLEHADYVTIVCGSIDRLPEAFAQLDQEDREKKLRGELRVEISNLGEVLQIATSSLPSADRQVVRTDRMGQKMNLAARSHAPKRNDLVASK